MRESSEDVFLTVLGEVPPNVRQVALKNGMTPDSLWVLRNLDLSDRQRADPDTSLSAIDQVAVRQVNEVLEQNFLDDILTSLGELTHGCNFCDGHSEPTMIIRILL